MLLQKYYNIHKNYNIVLSINQSINLFTTQHYITRFPYIYSYSIIILVPFYNLFLLNFIKKYCCAEGAEELFYVRKVQVSVALALFSDCFFLGFGLLLHQGIVGW